MFLFDDSSNTASKLSNFDLFGSTLLFTMKGRFTYNTKFDALVSFNYLTVDFFALLYFISRFLDKSDPNLQYTTLRPQLGKD
jgi:hypothetical protein